MVSSSKFDEKSTASVKKGELTTKVPFKFFGCHIHIQCCQVYGYIRILRIFKAFLDYGGISPCAAVSTDFSSHARALLF